MPRIGGWVRPVSRVDASAQAAAAGDSDGSRIDTDALLCAVGGGNLAAFENLYDAVAPQVFGLVRRVLADPAQAEEVTQEVFMELWRTADRYDPSLGKATSWTLRLAHSRAVDRVRAARASRERDLKVGARQHTVAYDDVNEQVEARLEAQDVRGCLEGLSDVQRESVQLAFYGGHTYPEVAELLSVPLGTVKTRLRDGLGRLRDCLGARDGS